MEIRTLCARLSVGKFSILGAGGFNLKGWEPVARGRKAHHGNGGEIYIYPGGVEEGSQTLRGRDPFDHMTRGNASQRRATN
jgi:hypothetical protein